jgi:hypothetical protein
VDWRVENVNRNNRGQVRIVEAFLAVLIVFSAFTASANVTATRSNPRDGDLASVGFETLLKLDSDNHLASWIGSGNWTAMRETLSLALPAGVAFNITIYDDQTQPVNTAVISNGAFGSQKVSSVEYICGDQSMIFHVYIIHLELAIAS